MESACTTAAEIERLIETFGADSQGAEQRVQEAIAARDAAVAASSRSPANPLIGIAAISFHLVDASLMLPQETTPQNNMVRKAQERLRKDMVR